MSYYNIIGYRKLLLALYSIAVFSRIQLVIGSLLGLAYNDFTKSLGIHFKRKLSPSGRTLWRVN